MKNDIARLKEEADIDNVIYHLGIPVTKRGSAFFILCPRPDHADSHPTNCYYKQGWNHVFCSVCRKNVNAIDLIMYTRNCSFGEAAEMLWEFEGCPDWYEPDEKKDKSPSLELSVKEAELIGLRGFFSNRILSPKKMTVCKEEIGRFEEYDKKELDGYLKCDVYRVNYHDFMSEKDFKELILSKCVETNKMNKQMIRTLNDSIKSLNSDSFGKLLLQSALKELIESQRQCSVIYNRTKKHKLTPSCG